MCRLGSECAGLYSVIIAAEKEKRGVMERLDQENRGGTIEVLEDLKRRSEMNDGINKEEWEIL